MSDLKKPAVKASESVTFIRAHRHGGKNYKVGDEALVTPSGKKKLLARQAVKK